MTSTAQNQTQLTLEVIVQAVATETCQSHDSRCETCDSTNPSLCGAPAEVAMVVSVDGHEVRMPFCEGHHETMTMVAAAITRS